MMQQGLFYWSTREAMLLLALFSVATCSTGPYQSEQTTQVPASEEDVQPKRVQVPTEDLLALGMEIRRIVETEDREAFLRYCRPEWAVAFGLADNYYLIENIKDEFQKRHGLLYCSLFDTECYREVHKGTLRNEAVSLKETLSTVEWELDVGLIPGFPAQEPIYYIIFKLKADLRSIGRLQNPSFDFTFSRGEWILTGVEME